MKRLSAAGLLLVALAAACGGPGSKAPATPIAVVKERVEIGLPRTCLAQQRIDALIGKRPQAAAPASEEFATSAPVRRRQDRAGASVEAAYEGVAPSVVLLRTARGFGTGVIIDAQRALILTNFHVVEPGIEDDFSLKVKVDLGRMTSTGRMERARQSYVGVVVKADPVRDLAIVKMIDPPAGLRSVTISERDPNIGEEVLSVGHAGIGFLWAAKGCRVASVGEQAHDMSRLQGMSCDAATMGPEALASKARCEEARKNLSEAAAAFHQGLAVQTDCAITHGDSGGPLVSTEGELLGLNQGIVADKATAAFHVHVAEVREFTQAVGGTPVQMPPDPWCDGGSFATLEDVDLDGTPDTVITKQLEGTRNTNAISFLIDLDQDTGAKQKSDPDAPFDAEIAVIAKGDQMFVYYDTDADGVLDVLLVDRAGDGSPDVGYRIGADESLIADKRLLSHKILDVSLLADRTMAARLGTIARVLSPSKAGTFTSRVALANAKVTPPDLNWGGKREGRLHDTDADRVADTLAIGSYFTRGYLIDSDQDSPRTMRVGADLASLGAAALEHFDAEAAFVQQAGALWALYDTNGDNKMDLALFSPPWDSSGVALGAWHMGADGSLTVAPEHHGRYILRLSLAGARARAAAAKLGAVAADDGLASFPNPKTPDADFVYRDVDGFSKVVIEAQSKSGHAILFDLDRDTTGDSKQTAEQLVNSGAFDAELAYLHVGDLEWAFYDTDGDKQFDLVLWSPQTGGKSVRAYRIDNAAKRTTLDRAASIGPLIRHSVFNDKAIGAKLKKVAATLFKPIAVEE
jgi:S1-C subfamily serine protease